MIEGIRNKLVTLPAGQQTVVFTLKEFRIDREGHVLKNAPRQKKKKTKSVGSERIRKGKLNQQKQKVVVESAAKGWLFIV